MYLDCRSDKCLDMFSSCVNHSTSASPLRRHMVLCHKFLISKSSRRFDKENEGVNVWTV